MTMNKLPNFNYHLELPSCGLFYRVDLDLSLLLPRLQELFEVDLKPVVIPLLIKLTRSMINKLEKSQVLSCLTKEGEEDLKNLQEQESNLISCGKDLNI